MGRKPSYGMKGKHQSDSAKKKISEAKMGSKNPNWKKHLSIETRKKLSLAHMGNKIMLGRHLSEKTKKKISDAEKGKKLSEEHRRKLRDANIGSKSHFWIDGRKGIDKYPVEWSNTLKRSIRERDHYTCRVCGEQQGERIHSVHHIDYNKNNCNPDNLITLCNICHGKTNSNREYWKDYLKKIVNG